MTTSADKMRPSAIIPLPAAALVGALFFMPWLNLSCDAEQVAQWMRMQNMPGPAEVPAGVQELGHASGWELAGGDISLSIPFQSNDEGLQGADEVLKARGWLYGGLALPVAILLLALGSVSGVLCQGLAGKAIVALSVVGILLTVCATRIDYVDDAMANMKDQASVWQAGPSLSFGRSVQQAGREMKRFVKTTASVGLWASVGLYSLMAVCGLAVSAQSPQAKPAFMADQTATPAHPGCIKPAKAPNFGPDITLASPQSPADRDAKPADRKLL